jgi:hypothetical protein
MSLTTDSAIPAFLEFTLGDDSSFMSRLKVSRTNSSASFK